jgi:hypothetical protein
MTAAPQNSLATDTVEFSAAKRRLALHSMVAVAMTLLKLGRPEVYRVTIHPEPVTDNLR